jgi:3-phosphoshikimate 1-carboxyvinyltransferase
MPRQVLRLLVKESFDPLAGEFVVPNSKYHAHRALILASLAEGTSRIEGLSDAGHVRHTIRALRNLGTTIRRRGDTFVVDGGPYQPAQRAISVGSSGSTLYFLTGLAALADAPVTITGQRYFQRRPIRPLLSALAGLGVELSAPTGCPPVRVTPGRPSGGQVSISGTLSQWISGLLLVAPFATGPSVITVDGPLNERSFIDLTVRMMAAFGLYVDVSRDGRRYEVEPNQAPRPATVTLPPDIGAAAFGLAATALHPSDVLFRGLRAVCADETDHPEAELLDIVSGMGLPMHRERDSGLVRVRHDGVELAPIDVDCRAVPDMLPVLSVLATLARGASVFDNVAHVRLKESDRVTAMLQLNRMGGDLAQRGDRLVCRGVEQLSGADLSSFNDHRVLMALAVAASRAEGESRLTYPHAYRISYPRFLDEMNAVGVSMAVESPSMAVAPYTARKQTAPGGHVPMPDRAARTPIDEHVRRWAAERPDAPAVVDIGTEGDRDQVTTWAELQRDADRLASTLLDLGVAPGEPVACQLPNCRELVVLSLAVLRIGAVCCPLMPIFRARETTFMLARSKARVLVVPARFRGRDYPAEVAELVAGSGADRLALAHVIVTGDEPPLPTGGRARWLRFADTLADREVDRAALDARKPAPSARAQLLFTSGTSGEPKGVLHRTDTLTRAAAMQARHLGLTGDDRVFIPSPLAHQTGFLYGMWLAFVLGAPQLLQASWDADVALAAIRRFNATFVQAASPFLADLTAAVQRSGTPPSALRVFVATGAAVPRALAERASRVLGAAVCGAWGTTESCLGSLAAPGDEPARQWGTDGRALDGVSLRVTDDDGRVLGPGQEGNFEVSSNCLFEGYLDHPEWTAEALTADGWYRSGDLAVIDESGYVRISGRVKDVVNRGGEKVPVGEIEQLLLTHPAVVDVAIVAMPDERLGERACAFLVANGLDLRELRRFLDARGVARPYWPERLEAVDALPRNPAGKVQKFVLREQVRRLIASEDDDDR